MAEIMQEWAGYCGNTEEVVNPDGTSKKKPHNKLWAAAVTESGHVYVRYGPAKQPLNLHEQIIRPKRGLSDLEALKEAERIFQEKVDEKLDQRRKDKGYREIPFNTPPHQLASFAQWRMSDEPETMSVATPTESTPMPQPEHAVSLRLFLVDLQETLLTSDCPWCHTLHPRYLVDLGNGQVHPPEAVIFFLDVSEQGQQWLNTQCVQSGMTLMQRDTREVLATIIDLAAEGIPECRFKPEELPPNEAV